MPGGRHPCIKLLQGAEQHASEGRHSSGLGHCLMLLHHLRLAAPWYRLVAWLLLSSSAGGLLQAAGAALPVAEQGLFSRQQSLDDVWSCCPAAGEGPFPDGAERPGDHLRKVFYRMGFNDQEIVALSGEVAWQHDLTWSTGWNVRCQSGWLATLCDASMAVRYRCRLLNCWLGLLDCCSARGSCGCIAETFADAPP